MELIHNALVSPGVYEVWNLSHPLFVTVAFLLGSCVGSFGNVCVWRMPRKESVVFVPSHCPSCDHSIPWYLNVPLLSWLVLRGRCRYCRATISCRYPLVEATVGALFVACWLKAVSSSPYGEPGFPLIALVTLWFVAFSVVVISLIDLEHFLIPDQLVRAGTVLAIALALLMPEGHFLDYTAEAARHHHMLTYGFLGMVLPPTSALLESDRFVAVVDAALGALQGGGILYLLGWLGDVFFGRKRQRSKEGVPITITQSGLTIDGESGDWDDWFPRYDEEIRIEGWYRDDAEKKLITAVVSEKGLKVGDSWTGREALGSVELTATEWVVPQVAMGMGDVKLMVMLGALFGPDAVIRILFLGCLLGSAIGLVAAGIAMVRKRPVSNKVAFGVALMVAAFAHMMLL